MQDGSRQSSYKPKSLDRRSKKKRTRLTPLRPDPIASECAGQSAAAIQFFLGTAKLSGLDPTAWLKDTMGKLLPFKPSDLEQLTQNNINAQR